MGIVIPFPSRTRKPEGLQVGTVVSFMLGQQKITGPVVQIKGEKCLVAGGEINIWQVPKGELSIIAEPPR